MSENQKTTSQGKGRPTPTRAEREAANIRPLVGARTKESRQAARAALAAKRAEARAGILSGDERFLGPQDKGPQRRFARDYVDSKFTMGELLLPSVLVSVMLSFLENLTVQFAVLVVLWTLMILVIGNALLLARKVKKLLLQKYGADKLQKGISMYVAMRTLQMRPMRLPKPRVKRGTKVEL